MRRLFFVLLIAFPFPLIAQTAKIRIDIERTVGEIDPKIYDVFNLPPNV